MRTIASIAVLTVVVISTANAQKGGQKSPPPKNGTHTEEKGWPLDVDGSIRVHNYNGSISITGWDKDSVSLVGTIAGQVNLFGGGSRRSAKMGLESGDVNTAPVADFVIFVPSRARLSVRGAATTIEIKNFAGTVDASTLSGRLKIAGPVTEITAETMDGDIDVEASPTYFRGKTATGRINWTGSSDDVALSTVSGTIVLASSTLYRGRAESISGDIKFTGAVKPGGHVMFESHGGDVTLSLSKETVGELIVDAPISRIMGDLLQAVPGQPRQLQMKIPRGTPRGNTAPADILARSFKGRVTVTQP